MTTLWLVGRLRYGAQWEVQGIFSTEEQAIAACRSVLYFIGPIGLDCPIPDETTEWTGGYFPLLEGRPK